MKNWESLIASKQREIVTLIEPDASKRARKITHRKWYERVKDDPEYKARHLKNVYAWRNKHDEEYKAYRRKYMREWRKTHKANPEKALERNRRYRARKKAMKEAA